MSGVNGCDKHPDRVIDCCVECLKLELSGYIDTVKAMLFAARGGECDLATLEREMNAVSTKPSEYIRHIVSSKDRQLADALEMLSDLKFLQEGTVLANADLKSQLAQARAEIESKNKLIEQMRKALENALKDMDRIDEVCKLAGVHAFTLMRKELEAALAAERGEL